MENTKQIRKMARCIKTLIETEGGNPPSATKIMDIIKDKNLDDISALKDAVANDMRSKSAEVSTNKPEKSNNRRVNIEAFVVSNWNIIKDNNDVKNALISAYCRGRYNKEQLATLKNTLLMKCGEETITVEEMEEEVATVISSEMEGEKYDF